MTDLTQQKLMEHVSYDQTTGKFILLKKTHTRDNTRKVGEELGYQDGRGYIHVSLFGKKYKAHRLAWLYVHGVWPSSMLDHIDGVRTNNSIVNLRECNESQNCANRKIAKSASGYKGVYPYRNEYGDLIGWTAQYNKKHLGVFQTKEDAARAYDKELLSVHGAFASLNGV